jgi:hypothetical protein
VLALVLAPVFATGLAFVLLYRKLDEIRRRLDVVPTQAKDAADDAAPAPVPLPAARYDDVALFVKVTVVVALIAMAVVYMPTPEAAWETALSVGLVAAPAEERPLDTWMASIDGLGRFQWHAFDLDNLTRYPVIECAAYENAHDLQVRLLGDLPEARPSDAHDPTLQQKRQEQRRAEERLRARARKRCVLNPPGELVTLDGNQMAHLTAPSAPSLSAVVRVSYEGLDNFPLNPVADVLLARDGARLYRVNVVVPNRTGSGVRLAQRIVTEEELLRAPRAWYRNFCENKAFKVYPCLCPAHLGYVNSGFYFHYPPAADDTCDRPGRLWAKARVVRALQGARVLWWDMVYQPYPTDFPLRVNEKLNVTGFEQAEITQIEYIDMAQLFDSARGHSLLDIHEPDWLAGAAPLVNISMSPLLAVLPLDSMTGREGPTIQSMSGEANACFAYCSHLDQVVLAQAGVV